MEAGGSSSASQPGPRQLSSNPAPTQLQPSLSHPPCNPPQLPYSSILVVAQAHSLQTQVFDATDVVVKEGGHSRVEQGSAAAVS